MHFSPLSSTSPLTSTVFPLPSANSSSSSLTTTTSNDSMSLFSFLQAVGTAEQQNKETLFDSQSVEALINSDFFLGVFQQLQFLAEKYTETVNYAGGIAGVTNGFNNDATNLNSAIGNYNTTANGLNNQITTMNAAIDHINGLTTVTPSDITTYNNAVATYNNYLTSIGNPGLLAYASAASTYNTDVAYDNNTTIPQLNATSEDLGFGIPLIPPLTPATAPAGSATYASQGNYSSRPIPDIVPISSTDLPTVSLLPNADSTSDIVNKYFLPFAQSYLAALAHTSQKLTTVDDYLAFINLVQKKGYNFNPAQVDAFIMNAAKPSTGSASASSDGLMGSMIVGIDTPQLGLVLSTALFNVISARAQTPMPPRVYDQLNALAASLLARLGVSAGISVIKVFGDKLKALGPGTASVDVAVSTALLQNILKVVADNGKATLPTLQAIIQGIPGISEGAAKQLANQLLAAQNISLLLNGATSVGIALQSPGITQDILNTTFNTPPQNNTSSQNVSSQTPTNPPPSDSTSETDATSPFSAYNNNPQLDNPYSSTALVAAINTPSPYTLQQTLEDRLKEDAQIPQPQSSSIINQALINTATLLPNVNSNESLFKQTLANELLKQNLNQTQTNSIVSTATAFLNQPNVPVLTPQELGDKLRSTIQAVTKTDVANALPPSVTNTLVKLLTDRNDPHSFISLYEDQMRNLEVNNDKQITDQLVAQRREFEQPNIDSFFIFKKWMDPSTNVVNSFMTGVMYDKTIPSNWQRPLSIQV